MVRTLHLIEPASNEKVGPFKIKNALPTRQLKQIDPFLLLHHASPFDLKPGDSARIPPHPHAGFEVVTYLLQGTFYHRDSAGHDVVANGGDINWMSSGTGLVHSEGPDEEFAKTGGPVELLQIWINLPAEQKKLKPSFTHYASAGFPFIEKENATVKVLMGEYAGERSPVSTHTEMFFYEVKLKAGTVFNMPVNETWTSALYVLAGQVKILNANAKAGDLADFAVNGDELVFTATEDSQVVVFGGAPIKEKVVSYGPFVMNSFEEVQAAIERYEGGQMGALDS